MFFIDFDPFLFFLMGFDCFEHDGGRCGWGTVWMGTALNKFDLSDAFFVGRELRQVGQRGAQRFPISAQSGVKLVVRVGHRLQTMPKTSSALDLYEGHMGRASLLDGVTSLRSLVSSLPAV